MGAAGIASMVFVWGGIAAYVLPLVLAAWCDITSRQIPNRLVLIFAFAYPAAALLTGHGADLPWHFAAGAGTFLVAALLFVVRTMGGGDVKLLGAAALWIGPGGLVTFALLTALIGGVFASAILVHRLARGAVRDGAPIPYGVPIALAGLILAPTLFAS
jgi:prepilin peptidase CpaA